MTDSSVGKRAAGVSIDVLDESKRKKPRFWSPSDSADAVEFPPSAVPSLFDIVRMEGVRVLDAAASAGPKEHQALLGGLFGQAVKQPDAVSFVAELVALQRLHDTKRFDRLKRDAVADLEKTADRFNDNVPDPEYGEIYDGLSRNELYDSIETANDSLRSIQIAIDDEFIETKSSARLFESISAKQAIEMKPQDAYAAGEALVEQLDRASSSAQWHFIGYIKRSHIDTFRAQRQMLSAKSPYRGGGGGSKWCQLNGSGNCGLQLDNPFYCEVHAPRSDLLMVATHNQKAERTCLAIGADIQPGEVLDVFNGTLFLGKPGPDDRVMQVRPGVWLDGRGYCACAHVHSADSALTLPSYAASKNAEFQDCDGVVVLVATRLIKQFDEILI